jgi:hypothetical protein
MAGVYYGMARLRNDPGPALRGESDPLTLQQDGGYVTTPIALRALSFAGRLIPSVVTAAAVLGLGIYAWRARLRVQEEQRWEVEWEAFQRHHRPRD